MGIPKPSIPLSTSLPSIQPLTFLRATQTLFALLTLSLAASVAATFNNHSSSISSPRQVNFLIFTSLFTLLLIIPYTTLAPRFFPRLAQVHVMLSAEASTALFWFAGFIASADLLRKSPLSLHSRATAIAATVFASLLFLTFAATTSFATHHLLTSSNTAQPRYKRTHYHSHSRNLSNLALEKHHAHDRFHARMVQHSCTSTDDLVAYPPPNIKILPKRGLDLEVNSMQVQTPPPRGNRPQPQREQSSWSPDSCTSPQRLGWGHSPRSKASENVGARPYSTRVAGRVRQGVGEIRLGVGEVGERLKARMPRGVQVGNSSGWFGKERAAAVPEAETGWRRMHEMRPGARGKRAEMGV
ncbi:uncharacterized protein HMPREF1541_08944 [Cyphellophora europaea CBS 101466]|uniref:MARVEL domain-containing protein n=1 Tax=Cyphellophora europaea (strain CBS 101466) TaxID=1220924 RepID=W2RJK6_CYPE1|nr:uncharacterized protein HMPREF1541_08944 [Cyphellophora europaea CBS 101466]ETN36666.1 hypothetical protein HMPREF1541_08944 [Cyphellophora europaea CBS 101466]